jgi:ribose transport system substrate-binding protein
VKAHLSASCALAAIVAAVVITGCGRGEEESHKVMYLLPTLSDEAYSREAAGARAEAAKVEGLQLDIQASAQRQDPTKQVTKIEDAITQGYDAIIVDPGESVDQLAPALRKAAEAGIKTITVVQTIPGLTPTAALTFDQVAVYREAGEYMSGKLPDGGAIGVITCVESNPDSKARIQGFEEGLAPNIKVAAFGDAKCDPAKARTLTENMITANPDLKGIFNNTDLAAVGTVEAVRASGKDIIVIGGDGQTANLEMMAARDIQHASPRYPSETFGAMAVATADQLVRGEHVPPTIAIPGEALITQDNAAEVLAEVQNLMKQNG